MRKPILFAAATCVLFAVAPYALAQAAQTSNAPPVNGSDVGSFFGSGAQVNPQAMERASIPADQAVSLPPGHNIKAPKPGQKIKKHGFVHGIGRAFAHTSNFIGFPVGDDKDVDASLSSDLQNEQNKAQIKKIERAQEAEAQAAKAHATSDANSGL